MRIGYGSSVHDKAKFVILLVVAVAGFAAWIMLPEPSDAQDQSAPASAVFAGPAQNAAPVDPATVPTQSIAEGPAEVTAPAEAPAGVATAPEIAAPETTAPAKSPLDGLKISAQSWRRGGLGSKALVTLTLRNRNDFAVKDIEIDCAFARRDGSHLTDRKRVISDVISMKSRKTYSGMLVGFVNINANKAKCSLVTASRI
jgi:type IV secretory pathway VirB10-like protein